MPLNDLKSLVDLSALRREQVAYISGWPMFA
jgi:hypothetical protein